MKLPWANIANALGYQLVWFAVLVSASRGNFWIGISCSLVFSILMLCFGGKTRQDARIVLIALVLGILIDTLFASSGWLEYVLPWPMPGFAPIWIIALWLSFSFTLNHSMSFLRNNYVVAGVFGLVGGPLAYWFADRAFNVIEYGISSIVVLAALGICWALVIPAIYYIDKRLSAFGSQKAAA